MIHYSAMEAHDQKPRLCDYCNSSVALLYCRADLAKLCLACDKEVHHTNQLFAKHSRSQLCDACDDAPASVFCETERSVLCQNCDWERHRLSSGGGGGGASSSVHSRRPVEGFAGCPTVTELVGIVGFDDLNDKSPWLGENRDDNGPPGSGSGGSSECLLWETPEIVSFDDLIASGWSSHNFRAMDIPHLPKNRHATCGKHKDEMLRQLRELAKSEPNTNCLKHLTEDAEVDDAGFQFLPASDTELLPTDNNPFPSWEMSGAKWWGGQDEDFSLLRNISSEERPAMVPEYPVDTIKGGGSCVEETAVMTAVDNSTRLRMSALLHHQDIINSQERDSALSRYKQKRKSRRYDKHIRYESRKVRAESRTRIRGRFAKADP